MEKQPIQQLRHYDDADTRIAELMRGGNTGAPLAVPDEKSALHLPQSTTCRSSEVQTGIQNL
jgi:hypothetical protein